MKLVLFILCVGLVLAGCDDRAPLASGSGGTDTVGTLGSLGSWVLIAGGSAVTLATIGFGLAKWFGIPGIGTLLAGIEIAGGACIIVGSVLEWLDSHRGAIVVLVALVGLLVAVRHRVWILRWLRIGPAVPGVTHV